MLSESAAIDTKREDLKRDAENHLKERWDRRLQRPNEVASPYRKGIGACRVIGRAGTARHGVNALNSGGGLKTSETQVVVREREKKT